MGIRSVLLRRVPALLLGATLAFTPALPTFAAGTLVISFRPHCEKEKPEECPAFETLDPTALQTPTLKPGETLDLDIILTNAVQNPVRRVRAWLSYDPQILEGVEITAGPTIKTPLPGEVSFSPADGLARIGFVKSGEVLKEKFIVVARVRFTVKEGAKGRSPISFYDPKENTSGHVYVINTDTQNLLVQPLVSLVTVHAAAGDTPAPAVASSEPSTAPTSSTPTAPVTQASSAALAVAAASSQPTQVAGASSAARSSAAPVPVAFPLLQVQNVRITTRDSSMFVAWEALRTTQLKGYNLYYGTQQGRYIQRRSLGPTISSAEIPNLATGVTYYAAVRAVNAQDQESAFSQEVGVSIGDPKSATTPLAVAQGGTTRSAAAPVNPVTTGSAATLVPGEAGLPEDVAPFLVAAAVVGALFAFRRQAIALPTTHDRD